MPRTGILLVNTGTPDAPEPASVKRYLSAFLMDRRIAPMNRALWWLILHLFILPKRSVASAEKYRAIWTPQGSPLAVTQGKLARALEARYAEDGLDVLVRSAMSYGEPSVERELHTLADAGCTRAVVLPLYPQSAHSTTGAVSDAVARAVRKTRCVLEVSVIDNYHDDAVYVRALAASIVHAGFDPDSDDRLLFSFHSIPLADIEDGDTYELQTGATSLAVANELGLDRKRWSIGYQCRFDKKRTWLSPFTSSVLSSWADLAVETRTAGKRPSRVFMVCPNFAIDCLETLYDIDCELKPAYVQRAGCEADEFAYVPCLNASKAQVKVLSHVLAPYVEGES